MNCPFFVRSLLAGVPVLYAKLSSRVISLVTVAAVVSVLSLVLLLDLDAGVLNFICGMISAHVGVYLYSLVHCAEKK